jgi:hypothetical protein
MFYFFLFFWLSLHTVSRRIIANVLYQRRKWTEHDHSTGHLACNCYDKASVLYVWTDRAIVTRRSASATAPANITPTAKGACVRRQYRYGWTDQTLETSPVVYLADLDLTPFRDNTSNLTPGILANGYLVIVACCRKVDAIACADGLHSFPSCLSVCCQWTIQTWVQHQTPFNTQDQRQFF